MVVVGWQAWKQRDTPLEALVLQSQLAAIQSLVENGRLSCSRRTCTDYYDQANEKMEICKGDTLDNAFGRAQDATNALKLIANPRLMNVVVRFNEMHEAHGLGKDDSDSNSQAVRFALRRKCEEAVDTFVSELRTTIGLGQLSSGLLARIGESAKDRPPRQ